jgi:hypothetical protein
MDFDYSKLILLIRLCYDLFFLLEICVRELNHNLESMDMMLEELNFLAGKGKASTAQPYDVFRFPSNRFGCSCHRSTKSSLTGISAEGNAILHKAKLI